MWTKIKNSKMCKRKSLLVFLILWITLMRGGVNAANSIRQPNRNRPKTAIGQLYKTNSSSVVQHAPACASNGEQILLFPDESLIKDAPNFIKIALYYCLPECNIGCSVQHQPVCGYDPVSNNFRNFINNCEMNRIACATKVDWTLYKNAECVFEQDVHPSSQIVKKRRKKTIRRPIQCTDVYSPVCAIYDGVKSTFHNECLVNAENVITGKDWRIFSRGICTEDYAKVMNYISSVRKTKRKRSSISASPRSRYSYDPTRQIRIAGESDQRSSSRYDWPRRQGCQCGRSGIN